MDLDAEEEDDEDIEDEDVMYQPGFEGMYSCQIISVLYLC